MLEAIERAASPNPATTPTPAKAPPERADKPPTPERGGFLAWLLAFLARLFGGQKA